MTEKDEEYELEEFKRNSSQEESTSSEIDEEKKDYLEVIDIIGALMQDKDFPLKDKSGLIINKIISFLNREIYRDRNFTEAWLIKGTVLYKTSKYNGAIDAFDGALESMQKEIPKEDMDSWMKDFGVNYRYALKFKSFSLCKLGRYKEAIHALDEISSIFPADPEIENYKNMICTFEKKKLLKGRSIPDSYPENSNASECGDRDSHGLGKYEEILEELEKKLENDPKDAEIWGNKGSALHILGRYEEALEAFNKSLEIDPKNENIWNFKGSTLYKLDRSDEALKALDKTLQKNPNIFEAWFNKGAILFELGRYKQALFAVENALRISTEDSNALNLKSSILNELERDMG